MKIGKLTAEVKATWKETELEDVQVLVTGLKTREFRRRLEQLLGQPSVMKQTKLGGSKEVAARDQAFNKALVDTVLKDWKHLDEDDGSAIEFDVNTALQLVTDSLAFRDAVVTAAGEVDDERFIRDEDLVGNSVSTSTGG